MTSKSLGVFDIGSNTVLLTCGYLDTHKKLKIVCELHDVARLGEKLQDHQPFHQQAKNRVLKVLKNFIEEAKTHGVKHFLAAGTAAFRRASDGEEFSNEIQSTFNIPIRILSGKEEAYYSYQSVLQDFSFEGEELGVIDIGGGSTEFVFGDQGPSQSIPLGTVLLLEKFIKHQPIDNKTWKNLSDEIEKKIKTSFSKIPKIPKKWVAVAATPTALSCLIQKLDSYQLHQVHGFNINLKILNQTLEMLRSMSITDREKLRGMLPKRGELLPIGGLILKEAMNFLQLNTIQVSAHGLRYALLRESLLKETNSNH